MSKDYTKLDEYELRIEFFEACKYGEFDIVKHLLTSPELKNCREGYGFRVACENEHLDIVKFLLTYPDFKNDVDIHAAKKEDFLIACESGNLDVVKYMLTYPEFKEHSDIHSQEDSPFIFASKCGHLKIIRFFIFDMDIEKTEYIEEHLRQNQNTETENMFKLRDVNKQLQNELNVSDITPKKYKI